MTKLGVIGVGDLADKLIRGLMRLGRISGGDVFLSPRNKRKSAALAEEFGCVVATTNQEVAEIAEILIVAVRPEQLDEISRDLSPHRRQAIISVVAGVAIIDLNRVLGKHEFVRAMLSYASEINQSTIAIYPRHPSVENLVSGLGRSVCFESEREFEIATVGACMNGWFYFLLEELQGWLMRAGLSEESARDLVLSSVTDCVAYSGFRKATSLESLGKSIATTGTLTARGLEALQRNGGIAGWAEACEIVFSQLEGVNGDGFTAITGRSSG